MIQKVSLERLIFDDTIKPISPAEIHR